MHPLPHTLIGGSSAHAVPLTRRDRAPVTLAGVIPDMAGLGLVAARLTRQSPHPLLWWPASHHVLAHRLGAVLVVAGMVVCLSQRRWVGTALAVGSSNGHLVGDVVGARGWGVPMADRLPIPLLRRVAMDLERALGAHRLSLLEAERLPTRAHLPASGYRLCARPPGSLWYASHHAARISGETHTCREVTD